MAFDCVCKNLYSYRVGGVEGDGTGIFMRVVASEGLAYYARLSPPRDDTRRPHVAVLLLRNRSKRLRRCNNYSQG